MAELTTSTSPQTRDLRRRAQKWLRMADAATLKAQAEDASAKPVGVVVRRGRDFPEDVTLKKIGSAVYSAAALMNLRARTLKDGQDALIIWALPLPLSK